MGMNNGKFGRQKIEMRLALIEFCQKSFNSNKFKFSRSRICIHSQILRGRFLIDLTFLQVFTVVHMSDASSPAVILLNIYIHIYTHKSNLSTFFFCVRDKLV